MPLLTRPLRAVGRGLWWLLKEGIPAALLLIACGLLIWTVFAVNRYKLPLTTGDFGDYGVIDVSHVIGPDTAVIEFSATRLPSRIITYTFFRGRILIVWPVPPTLQVGVSYLGPDKVRREWVHTYYLACDKDGQVCTSMDTLRGVILHGRGPKGELQDRGWVYFPSVRPPQEHAVPGPPLPRVLPPKPSPQTLPPGAIIRV